MRDGPPLMSGCTAYFCGRSPLGSQWQHLADKRPSRAGSAAGGTWGAL